MLTGANNLYGNSQQSVTAAKCLLLYRLGRKSAYRLKAGLAGNKDSYSTDYRWQISQSTDQLQYRVSTYCDVTAGNISLCRLYQPAGMLALLLAGSCMVQLARATRWLQITAVAWQPPPFWCKIIRRPTRAGIICCVSIYTCTPAIVHRQ